jgi:hypothetical protein
MFNNVSYLLYSDDYLTSSSLNEKELPKKVSNSSGCRPIRNSICQKRTSSLSLGRRSNHIILFREDILKRNKSRILARRLREKRQLLEENIQNKIKQLEDEQLFLTNDLRQRQSYRRDLKTEIDNDLSMDSLTELLSINNEKMSLSSNQYSNDFEPFNISITRVLDLNNNIDDKLDS